MCVGGGGGEGVELRKHFTDCTLVEMLTTANDPDIIINYVIRPMLFHCGSQLIPRLKLVNPYSPEHVLKPERFTAGP